jgi:predicted TIM-barrel fold metal-dependent hydrolase
MRDDMFVFDNVVHMYDNRADNVIDPTAMNYMNRSFSSGGRVPTERQAGRATQVEDALRLLFEDSEADMAMAQTVPLFSYWRDGFAPAERQYALAAAAPDRVLFCGGVDPVHQGLKGALSEMDRQAQEWGATSFKFYQGHRAGLTWRADDRRLAYPLWERMSELGIPVAQFHKGIPLGHEYVEDLRPNDVQQAAIDFPEMTFVLHHFGEPYIDETINIAARFKNVWLSLSAIINLFPVAPWTVYECLGKALANVGASRILWGSEAFAFPRVQPFIEAFATMQMPQELQDRYGYPAITDDARRKILGLNMARLMNVDVEAKLRELYPGRDPALLARAAGKDTGDGR